MSRSKMEAFLDILDTIGALSNPSELANLLKISQEEAVRIVKLAKEDPVYERWMGLQAPANRVIAVHLEIQPRGDVQVHVLKEFTPENGGGVHNFQQNAPDFHRALDIAKGLVTMTPGQRPQ